MVEIFRMSDSVVKIWNERMTQIMTTQLISYFIKNVFLVPPRLHQVCYRSVTRVTGILLGEDKTDITGLTKSDPDILVQKERCHENISFGVKLSSYSIRNIFLS